jgi:hypothetical protein
MVVFILFLLLALGGRALTGGDGGLHHGINLGKKFFHFLRLFVGDVLLFADVGDEVV